MTPSTISLYRDAKGRYRWRLKAPNGKIIADSGQGYARAANRKTGIRAMALAFGMDAAQAEIPREGAVNWFWLEPKSDIILIIRNDDDK